MKLVKSSLITANPLMRPPRLLLTRLITIPRLSTPSASLQILFSLATIAALRRRSRRGYVRSRRAILPRLKRSALSRLLFQVRQTQ